MRTIKINFGPRYFAGGPRSNQVSWGKVIVVTSDNDYKNPIVWTTQSRGKLRRVMTLDAYNTAIKSSFSGQNCEGLIRQAVAKGFWKEITEQEALEIRRKAYGTSSK